jgi:hypothetical protein
MQRARVVSVPGHHFFREPDDFGSAFIRRAVARPVTPRPQVHDGLNVEHRDVLVIRELEMHFAHRIGISCVARFAIFSTAGIALCECVDQRLLAR